MHPLLRTLVSVSAVLIMILQAECVFAEELSNTEIIVRWNSDVSFAAKSPAAQGALQEAVRRVGVVAKPSRELASGSELIELSRVLTAEELRDFLATVRQSKDVQYAHENAIAHMDFTPNDSLYSRQWSYFHAFAGIRAPEAWDLSTGEGVVVAVVDTGTTHHPDLERNVIGGYDFISNIRSANDGTGRDSIYEDSGTWSEPADNCPERDSVWHGDHVSGTIAALTHNARGVAGVAFNSKIVTVRALGRCGGGSLTDIADGMYWASGMSVSGVPANTHPARILNLSLGAPGSCPSEMQTAIDRVRAANVLIVVSAGNNNANAAQWPANCTGVVTVVSTNISGGKSFFSDFGANVSLGAPGETIWSTYDEGLTIPTQASYINKDGTSMAAPQVTGVAALVMSRFPSLTADEVATRLRETARWFPTFCGQCGWGLVNAYAAVHADPALAPAKPTGVTVSSWPDAAGWYTVSWNPAARATEYFTQRLVNNVWVDTARTTGTSWTLNTGQQPLFYVHRVKACNDDDGCGDWTSGALVVGCTASCQ